MSDESWDAMMGASFGSVGMSDNDLIRRGDARRAMLAYASSYSAEEAETAIAALPAVTLPDDVERLIAEAEALSAMINMGEKIAWGRDTAMIDALIAALRAMQSERDNAWKVAHDATSRGMKAEAKLAEVEKERDHLQVERHKHQRRAMTAEATVATLTAQVEAMRDQLAARGDELTKAWHRIEQADELAASVAAPRYGMHGMPAHVSEALMKYRKGDVKRAALTTENQTNG